MRKKTVTKKLLSILLCLALSIGTVYVPGVVSEAKTEKKQSVKRAGTVETTALKADNNSAATVDSTVVDASYLFSHTEKSSELKDKDAPSNGVENAGLTSSEDVYNELGFNSSELQKNVEDIQTDPNNQNVLAGYTLLDPKEVILLKTKDYNTTIDTIDDEAFNLSGSMKWEKAADQLKYSRDTSLQSEAVKLMDVDGDGIDELIRQRIFVKDKKTWMDLYGFRMINGSWSTQGAAVTYQLSTGTGNWQDKFWTDEKGGYTSMAVGDFDGDEKGEELAVYVPGDATMPDSERARVVILKWNTSLSGVTELGKINMSSIKSYYMDMKSGYHAPSVSLQATHSRLKSEIPDESKSFTRWSTYTDLVVNATVPPAYRKNSSIPSLNATTTIYSYLSFLAINYDIPEISEVMIWFESCIIRSYANPMLEHQIMLEKYTEYKNQFIQALNDMDIDITDYRYDEDSKQLYMKRKLGKKEYELSFTEESDGTRKLIAALPVILLALREGRLVIIDELDAKLHPKLLRYVILLFKNKDINRHGAQLLFTSHDMSTMKNTIFRRDEIWFAADNEAHESDVYSLHEMRSEDGSRIKNTATYDKQYLEGRYGADPIPSHEGCHRKCQET